MFETLILLVIAFPMMAIVGFIMGLNTRDRLSRLEFALKGLDRRLADLSAATGGIVQKPAGAGPSPVPEQQPEQQEPGRQDPASAGQFAPEPLSIVPESPGPVTAPPTEPIATATVPPVPPAAGAAEPRPGFEERFGTQWVVWVGGIAVAFGGYFLLRYSIEQGWFGPGMRVFLGAVLAAALIALGEWTRRRENITGLHGLPAAHIPSILTAAGTTVAYADVWAAYGLYDFIGSAAAFLLLGIVALATLAAALLHGPALAGLGLVGAFVTPLIVSSNEPNYWALYLYLGVVTAAAFALARMRMWRWLAVTTIVFGVLWTLPGIGDYRVDWLTPHNFHVVAGFVLVALLIVSGFLFGPDAPSGRIDMVSSAGLAAYLLASGFVVLASDHASLALVTYAALVAATVAIAWRAESATAAVPAAAVLTLLVFAAWAVQFNVGTLVAPSGPLAPTIPDPPLVNYTWHIVVGTAFALLFGVSGFLAQGRSERPLVPMLWSASAVFAPIAILVALYFRITGFDQSFPFAGIALLLAVLFASATEMLGKREPRPGMAGSGAIFATGTIAALALAFTMSMERGWLTVALALMVPGIAWVSEKRPLPALRWLAAVVVTLVLARIAWEPRIVGDDVGTTPIVNWILYGYGIPAAAFWLAGIILRRRADDVPTRTVEAGAILFTVLLAFLEIRHAVTAGDIYRPSSTLTEVALQVCVGLAMTIGLERLRVRSHSIVHNVAALIIAGLTLVTAIFGLLLLENPLFTLFTRVDVGGRFVNLLLLGYALPAILAAVLALSTRGMRSHAYSVTAAIMAVTFALAYLSLEVRRLYQGPTLWSAATGDAEQYTYSGVWLLFGVALLAVGAFLRSQPVRIASAAVVMLTVLKVFFIDMSGLTGIYQALSFIGLGLVLLAIGWCYQRLLFPPRPRSQPAAAQTTGGAPP
jgi:uncharacterized membrane protein